MKFCLSLQIVSSKKTTEEEEEEERRRQESENKKANVNTLMDRLSKLKQNVAS